MPIATHISAAEAQSVRSIHRQDQTTAPGDPCWFSATIERRLLTSRSVLQQAEIQLAKTLITERLIDRVCEATSLEQYQPILRLVGSF